MLVDEDEGLKLLPLEEIESIVEEIVVGLNFDVVNGLILCVFFVVVVVVVVVVGVVVSVVTAIVE